MSSTIDYYNRHASEYFENTLNIQLNELYEKFLRYIPVGGRIIDLGCGSGRDVKWFIDHGYDASGLDASAELVKIAREKYQIPIEIGTIENWISDSPYDGIWCCASLMHLDYESVMRFFSNLKTNLKHKGVLFMSMKSGIDTGIDDQGRYFKDYTEIEVQRLVGKYPNLKIKEMWYTCDKMSRMAFKWLNAIIMEDEVNI